MARAAKPNKLDDRGKASPKGKKDEKIRKPMKRISNGELHQQAQDKTPPPVPALPKDYLQRTMRQSPHDLINVSHLNRWST